MGNTLAIAAVTATLRNLLEKGIVEEGGGMSVTTRPPDKAREFGPTDGLGRLNLFLYQTQINSAWSNRDMPQYVKPNETGQAPLALDLFYLITAYEQSEGDTSILGHRLLGRAMRVLHDHPLLGKDEIQNAIPDNDLYLQIERVRITPQPMSLEEMSKLWTIFQTEYRISAVYQVAVILIESARLSKSPLPVLTRGASDSGVVVLPSLVPPFPTLETLTLPNNQPSAELGDTITLSGHDLDGATVTVQFSHALLENPIDVIPDEATSTAIIVTLPNDPVNWPAGFYTVSALVTKPSESEPRITNALALSLAPRILALPMSVSVDANGDLALSLTCEPDVRSEQRAALLLGSQAFLADTHAAQTSSLTFQITDAPLGEHFIRLRIDGVDSLLIDQSVTPPIFKVDQKVTIS